MTESENRLLERMVRVEEKLDSISHRVGGIEGYFKWIVIGLGGVILTAIGQFILRGGLNLPGGGG